jgi:hypothetical protein
VPCLIPPPGEGYPVIEPRSAKYSKVLALEATGYTAPVLISASTVAHSGEK